MQRKIIESIVLMVVGVAIAAPPYLGAKFSWVPIFGVMSAQVECSWPLECTQMYGVLASLLTPVMAILGVFMVIFGFLKIVLSTIEG